MTQTTLIAARRYELPAKWRTTGSSAEIQWANQNYSFIATHAAESLVLACGHLDLRTITISSCLSKQGQKAVRTKDISIWLSAMKSYLRTWYEQKYTCPEIHNNQQT